MTLYSIWFIATAPGGKSDQSPPHTAFVMTQSYLQQSSVVVYHILTDWLALGLEHYCFDLYSTNQKIYIFLFHAKTAQTQKNKQSRK